jgi:hypothetical protein
MRVVVVLRRSSGRRQLCLGGLDPAMSFGKKIGGRG